MSAANTLTVPTIAGLTLMLRRDRGNTSATLQVPEGKAPAGASATERIAAHFHAGERDRVRLEPRADRYNPPVLWVASAGIDIDDTTAATVQAWLESRPAASDAPAAQAVPA